MMCISDNMALYYLKDDNVFIDGEGEIVFEIFEVISPNDLYMFKRNKRCTTVNHHSLPGSFVDLYWPEEEYEEQFFDVGDDYERIERYEKAKANGSERRLIC